MKALSLSIASPLLVAIALIASPSHARPDGLGGGDRGDWFEKADGNHNGRVTRAEFAAYRQAQFDQLDRNRDGVVSPADFPRLAKVRPDAYARLTAMLDQADANGDGAISRAEMNSAPPRLFNLADADHDGEVTQAEFVRAREAMQAAMAARRQ